MPVLYTALPSGPAAVSERTGISLLLMNHSKKGPDLDKTTNVYEFYCRNLSFSLLSGLVSLKPLWGSRRLPPSQQERWSGLITASAHIAGWPGQTTWHCFYRDESDLLIWLWLRKNKKYQYWCVYSRLQKTSVSSYSSYTSLCLQAKRFINSNDPLLKSGGVGFLFKTLRASNPKMTENRAEELKLRLQRITQRAW